MEKRIALTVAYDGTAYCGWQIQNNGKTIQGELNRCLTELLEIGRASCRDRVWLKV